MTTEQATSRAWMEWAVRYGDGATETCTSRATAEAEVRDAARIVERQSHGWEAYDGARVVGRRIEERRTAWLPLAGRCPGHALTCCADCEWT